MGTGSTIPHVSSGQGAAEQPATAWQQLSCSWSGMTVTPTARSYTWFSPHSLTEQSCCWARNPQRSVKCWSFPRKNSFCSLRFI